MADLAQGLFYGVGDVVAETDTLIKQMAAIGYSRLANLRVIYPEVWGEYHEAQLQRLYDISRGYSSWREAKLEALDKSRQMLEFYGGSGKSKARGLTIIENGINYTKEERK